MTATKTAPRMSRLKAIDPKAAEPSRPKMVFFGRPGVGKTWFATDFPSVYYIDPEGGADLERYTDKLAKANGMYLGVKQGALDPALVLEQMQALATEPHRYKTVVIDSYSKIFNTMIGQEQERLTLDPRYDPTHDYGASKKPAVAWSRKLINWITRIDMNVILVCHQKELYEGGENVGVTFDGWDKLDYELHLCLHVKEQGPSRIATPTKSRLKDFIKGQPFPFSYEEFAKRFGKDKIEAETQLIELASPAQLEELKELLTVFRLSSEEQQKCFDKEKVETWSEMSTDSIAKYIGHIKGKLAK